MPSKWTDENASILELAVRCITRSCLVRQAIMTTHLLRTAIYRTKDFHCAIFICLIWTRLTDTTLINADRSKWMQQMLLHQLLDVLDVLDVVMVVEQIENHQSSIDVNNQTHFVEKHSATIDSFGQKAVQHSLVLLHLLFEQLSKPSVYFDR